jgi:ribulose 1,5-bisphosphate synthetase/thiazole synthase
LQYKYILIGIFIFYQRILTQKKEEYFAFQQYDLIVIGSGNGALGAAFRIKEERWSVAFIDSLPFGGTCARRACDPKKILVGAKGNNVNTGAVES